MSGKEGMRHYNEEMKNKVSTDSEKTMSLEKEVKRLRMENELLRNFLSAVGRR